MRSLRFLFVLLFLFWNCSSSLKAFPLFEEEVSQRSLSSETQTENNRREFDSEENVDDIDVSSFSTPSFPADNKKENLKAAALALPHADDHLDEYSQATTQAALARSQNKNALAAVHDKRADAFRRAKIYSLQQAIAHLQGNQEEVIRLNNAASAVDDAMLTLEGQARLLESETPFETKHFLEQFITCFEKLATLELEKATAHEAGNTGEAERLANEISMLHEEILSLEDRTQAVLEAAGALNPTLLQTAHSSSR